MVSKINYPDNYRSNRPRYELLGERVHTLVKDILTQENITPHAISYRVKDIDSFEKKIKLKNYVDPLTEVTDLCGVRIICYVEDDVEKVCNQIKMLFHIDEAKSVNKNVALGENRVGYKSIHLICQIGKDRLAFPEYKKFEGMFFEVQIRTILQHCWAEIEHDKNYKFSGVLPIELKRRLMLLSGTLELVDREFNQLSKEIDKYANSVNMQTKTDNLDIEIDSVSLSEYLSVKFTNIIKMGLVEDNFNNSDKARLGEMKKFRLNTLADFNRIIPEDFEDALVRYPDIFYLKTNFVSLVRDIMVIHDIKRVVQDVKPDWVYIGENKLLEHYKVDKQWLSDLIYDLDQGK